MGQSKIFSTSDVNLSAFILARGAAKFSAVEWERPDQAVFHFSPPPKDDMAAAYANNETAPAQSLFGALKFLRTRMNEVRPRRNNQR